MSRYSKQSFQLSISTTPAMMSQEVRRLSQEQRGQRGSNNTAVDNPNDAGPKVEASVMEVLAENRSKKTLSPGLPHNEGSILSAHDICYSVKQKQGKCGSVRKQILFNVNAVYKPGMNALLGTTGSGKSTFLDVLAGRKDQSNVTGNLLLDGYSIPNNYKCMVGYVVQDDVVMGTLTIRENLAFSAALRLPTSISRKEKNKRVDEVIRELGLFRCADTKVGNEFVRGVSGGERKRCNIGMELIIYPLILFLDEPTTGLDANTANTVLLFLKRISRGGRTIIFSIHQPRYTIFTMFDQLTLLCAGRTIYNGPSDDALTFFSELGYECPKNNNPPDFFLDVINGDPLCLGSGAAPSYDEEDERKALAERAELEDKLTTAYKNSRWCKQLEKDLSAIWNSDLGREQGKASKEGVTYATSFFHQLTVVAWRSLKNVIRNPQTSGLTIGTSFFFAFMVSTTFWQVSDEPTSAFQDRGGAMFFLLMNQMFVNLSAIEVFISERKIFLHENLGGFYHTSVYFFVKVLFDILPLRIVPVAILVLITYPCVGFRPGLEHEAMHALTLFSCTMAATSLAFLYSACFRQFAVAQILMVLTFVLMVLTSGFMINLDSIGPLISWMQHVSIMKYGLTNLYMIEFRDREFCGYMEAMNRTGCTYGNAFLKRQAMEFNETKDIWLNLMYLAIMTGTLMTLTYLRLRFMKKTT